LHNEQALRIRAVISEKPPIARYVHIIPVGGHVELFDENNRPTGVYIVKAEHYTGHIEVDVFPNAVAELELEVPVTDGVVTPDPGLPPTDGIYRTAADIHAEYVGQDGLHIILQDVRHRPFADPQPIVVDMGADEMEQFDSSLTATALITAPQYGLQDVEVPVQLGGVVTTVVFGKNEDHPMGTFATEIVSMSLAGEVAIPGLGMLPVEIRTSENRPSTGETSITDLGGGLYHIDSFFDVFTELSVDGGGSFIPATEAARVDLEQSGVRTDVPELPPNDGVYRTAAQIHAAFSGPDLQVILQDVRHRPFADQGVERWAEGADEHELFQSSLTATAVITSDGLGLNAAAIPVELTGPVETVVYGHANDRLGTFDAEIVSMQLMGTVEIPGGPVVSLLIRESDTRDSKGQTSTADLGGGQFDIDSFFDVFTELSLDGGQSYMPAEEPARVELVPAPVIVTLTGQTEAHVFFETAEGQARDDDGNGLEEVRAELVDLNMTGTSPLGPVQVRLHPTLRSKGQIEELANRTDGVLDIPPFATVGMGDSFFDVYFEVEVGGQLMYTAKPKRMSTLITHKPPAPGDVYENPDRIPLLDADGNETGFYLGAARHEPNPGARIIGTHVFYNNSVYDNHDPGPSPADNKAIAPDKTALWPGETATLANYTSYSQGLNGIMIDVIGLPLDVSLLDASSFRFRMGNDDEVNLWQPAPAPQYIDVKPAEFLEGASRVTLIWNQDEAVRGQWLEVTMLADEHTGLTEDATFYYGNAIGESGNPEMEPYARVNAIDILLARNNPHNIADPAQITTLYDFNRDARVNATDMLIARSSQTHYLEALKLITPQVALPVSKMDDATESDKVAAHQAVLEQAADGGSSSSAKMEWLCELEQTWAQTPAPKKDKSAAEIADLVWGKYE